MADPEEQPQNGMEKILKTWLSFESLLSDHGKKFAGDSQSQNPLQSIFVDARGGIPDFDKSLLNKDNSGALSVLLGYYDRKNDTKKTVETLMKAAKNGAASNPGDPYRGAAEAMVDEAAKTKGYTAEEREEKIKQLSKFLESEKVKLGTEQERPAAAVPQGRPDAQKTPEAEMVNQSSTSQPQKEQNRRPVSQTPQQQADQADKDLLKRIVNNAHGQAKDIQSDIKLAKDRGLVDMIGGHTLTFTIKAKDLAATISGSERRGFYSDMMSAQTAIWRTMDQDRKIAAYGSQPQQPTRPSTDFTPHEVRNFTSAQEQGGSYKSPVAYKNPMLQAQVEAAINGNGKNLNLNYTESSPVYQSDHAKKYAVDRFPDKTPNQMIAEMRLENIKSDQERVARGERTLYDENGQRQRNATEDMHAQADTKPSLRGRVADRVAKLLHREEKTSPETSEETVMHQKRNQAPIGIITTVVPAELPKLKGSPEQTRTV